MKKIYQNPKINVIKIQPVRIMTGSNPEGFNPNPDEKGGDGTDGLSKGGWNWSDEPEMDYE